MGHCVKLSPARVDLALALEGMLTKAVGVIDHLPDSIAPPCVLVSWADPWLKPSTLCAYEAAMELIVIAQRIEPGGSFETLEGITQTIVPSMKGLPGWQVVDVTAPYPMQVGGVDYLAASINLTYDMEEE
jgi:hypothetical protein